MSYRNLLALLFFSIGASANPRSDSVKCSSALRILLEYGQERPLALKASVGFSRPFQPEAVFQSNGLDAAKMSFRLKKHQDSTVYGIEVYYDGRKIGNTAFFQVRDQAYLIVPSLDDDFRSKGLGTYLYLLSARLIHGQWGIPLRNTQGTMSAHSLKLWKGLVNSGYAEERGLRHWEIKREILDNGLLDDIYRFFEKRLDPAAPESPF